MPPGNWLFSRLANFRFRAVSGRLRSERRSAENHLDRLPALAAELIHWPVAVIVGNNISARAAKAATTTVPIVFADGGDPVRDGLVASLNRPGGNVTGVVFFVLGEKRLDLLRQLVPKATTIAMLVYPNTADTEAERRDVQAAAQAIGQQLVILDASSDRDIEPAFAMFVQRGAGALLVGAGAFFNSHRERQTSYRETAFKLVVNPVPLDCLIPQACYRS